MEVVVHKFVYIYSRYAETLKVNFRRTGGLSKSKYCDNFESDNGGKVTERSEKEKERRNQSNIKESKR